MLSFTSTSPLALLQSIKTSINNKSIVTWTYDASGDFTHTPNQWAFKAWLRPFVIGSELRFSILCPQSGGMSKEVYAVYHGRFTEMMLAHFDERFTSSFSTAMPLAPDIVRAA